MNLNQLLSKHLPAFKPMFDSISQDLGNNGCNDYDLPNTDENWELMQAVEEWGEDESDRTKKRPTGKRLTLSDWLVFDYLVHLLKQEAENQKNSA